MKKLKKLLAGVITLAMAMSMMTMTAFAAPTFDGTSTGTLTIHKKAYGEGTQLGGAATGEELSDDDLPAGVTALNGVEFTIYQVVDEAGLEEFYKSNPTALPDVSTYVDMDNNKIKDGVAKLTKVETTAGEGVATFSDLPLGLYVVIETKSPDLVTQPVKPFMVSIPMTKTTGDGWLYSVHVYPKNGTNASGELTLVKKGKTIGVEGSETTLNNVEFVLQKLNKETSKWETITATTDASGKETPLVLTTANAGTITVSGLADGEYRFIEREIHADGDKNVGYIMDGATTYNFTVSGGKFTYGDKVNQETLAIEVVNEKPNFEKEITDKEGNTGDGADYSVGDLIEYKLTFSVPEKIADLKTFYIVDTPTNLDDKADTVKIWDGSTELSVGTATKEGEHGFRFDFTKGALDAYKGKTLTVTYKAELLEGAIETVENGNDAKLVYSSNILPKDDPDNPNKEDKPKIDEIEKTAYAYSYKLKVIKKADSENGSPLEGVEFDLYKEASDGTVTGDAAKALGLDASKTWKKINTAPLTTGADGTITQGGLANGTYYLVETKTNPSYNLLAKPVAVTLKVESTTATKTETTTVTAADGTVTSTTKTTVTVTHSGTQGDNAQGIWDQTVVNKKGFTLPETGGMGTFVFTFVGIAMMAAAVILFITSKKKTVK